MSVKADMYAAVSDLYMGLQAEEEQKMGDRLAWCNRAVDRLAKATKAAEKGR